MELNYRVVTELVSQNATAFVRDLDRAGSTSKKAARDVDSLTTATKRLNTSLIDAIQASKGLRSPVSQDTIAGLRSGAAAASVYVAQLRAKTQATLADLQAERQGQAAVAKLNQERRIQIALAEAGVTAEHALGRAISAQIVQYDRLQREILQTRAARASDAAAAETQAAAIRDAAAAEAQATRRNTAILGAVGIAAAYASWRALTGAISLSISEAGEAQSVFAQLEAVVNSTGGAAGFTAQELAGYSGELSKLVAKDDEVIQQGQVILLQFDKIGHDIFPRATRAALDLATRTGSVEGAFELLGKALQKPDEAFTQLERTIGKVTNAQQKEILALAKSGHQFEAQALLLDIVEKKVGGAAEAYASTLPGAIEKSKIAVNNLAEAVGQGLAPELEAIASKFTDAADSAQWMAQAQQLGEDLAVSLHGVIVVVSLLAEGFDKLGFAIAGPVGWLFKFNRAMDAASLAMQAQLAQEAPAAIMYQELRSQTEQMTKAQADRTSSILGTIYAEQALAKVELARLQAQAIPKTKVGRGGAEYVVPVPKETLDALSAAKQRVSTLETQSKQLNKEFARLAELGLKPVATELGEVSDKADAAAKRLASLQERLAEFMQKQRDALADAVSKASDVPKGEDAKRLGAAVQDIVGNLRELDAMQAEGAKVTAAHRIEIIQLGLAMHAVSEQVRRSEALTAFAQKGAEIMKNWTGVDLSKLEESAKKTREEFERTATAEEKSALAIVEARKQLELGKITAEQYRSVVQSTTTVWQQQADEITLAFEAAFATLEPILAELAGEFSGIIRDSLHDGKLHVEDFGEAIRNVLIDQTADWIAQWLAEWFKAMAAWLARWIATQRMAQAASAATNLAGAGGSGAGGMAWNMGQAALGAKGGGGTSSAVAKVFSSTAGGFAIAIAGMYWILTKSTRDAIQEGAASLGGATEGNSKKLKASIKKAVDSIRQDITGAMDELDLSFTALGDVFLGQSGKTAYVRDAFASAVGKSFSSMEEAVEYFKVRAIQLATFTDDVSDYVQTAIRGSRATTMAGLASDIDFGRMLESLNIPESVRDLSAQLAELGKWFDDTAARAQDLYRGSALLPQILADIGKEFDLRGQGIRDWITGAVKTEGDLFEQRRNIYNEWVKNLRSVTEAEITATESSLATMKARLEALMASTEAEFMLTRFLTTGIANLEAKLNELRAQLNNIPTEIGPEERPRGNRGGGGRNERQDFRDQLKDIAEGTGLEGLRRLFYDYKKQLADLAEEQKKSKAPMDEYLRALAALRGEFQKGVKQRIDALAGIGTDFTGNLEAGLKEFADARELGRKETGIPDWKLNVRENQFKERMKSQFQNEISEFAGIADPMAAINMRAAELRQNLKALGEAGLMTAEEINAAKETIEKGIEFQRQQGIISVLDRMWAVLQEDARWSQFGADLARMKAELELGVIEAQLRAFGIWDQYAEVFNAFKAKLLEGAAAMGDELQRSFEQAVLNRQEEWAQRFADAVREFADATRELMTNEELSNLTQEQQLAFAKKRVEDLMPGAMARDPDSIRALTQARAEYLSELRQSFGGGAGFSQGWNWIMGLTRDVLNLSGEYGDQDLARQIDAMLANTTAVSLNSTAISSLMVGIEGLSIKIGGLQATLPPPQAASPAMYSPGGNLIPFPVQVQQGEVVLAVEMLQQEVVALRSAIEGPIRSTAGNTEKVAANSEQIDRSIKTAVTSGIIARVK